MQFYDVFLSRPTQGGPALMSQIFLAISSNPAGSASNQGTRAHTHARPRALPPGFGTYTVPKL